MKVAGIALKIPMRTKIRYFEEGLSFICFMALMALAIGVPSTDTKTKGAWVSDSNGGFIYVVSENSTSSSTKDASPSSDDPNIKTYRVSYDKPILKKEDSGLYSVEIARTSVDDESLPSGTVSLDPNSDGAISTIEIADGLIIPVDSVEIPISNGKELESITISPGLPVSISGEYALRSTTNETSDIVPSIPAGKVGYSVREDSGIEIIDLYPVDYAPKERIVSYRPFVDIKVKVRDISYVEVSKTDAVEIPLEKVTSEAYANTIIKGDSVASTKIISSISENSSFTNNQISDVRTVNRSNATNSPLQYFGYYQSMPVLTNGNIDGVKDHVNFVDVCWGNIQDDLAVIRAANVGSSHKISAIVCLDSLFEFTDSNTWFMRLKTDYATQWSTLKATIDQFQDIVFAFSQLDEPDGRQVPTEQLETVSTLVKQSYPNIPIALNLMRPYGYTRLPDNHDWVGVTAAYGVNFGDEQLSYLALKARINAVNTAAGTKKVKMVKVGDGYDASSNPVTLTKKADAVYASMKAENLDGDLVDVVAYWVFLWHDSTGASGYSVQTSQPLQDKFRAIGRKIIGEEPDTDPPTTTQIITNNSNVTCSSSPYANYHGCEKVIDGDWNTIWSSPQNDLTAVRWIKFDLSANYDIQEIILSARPGYSPEASFVHKIYGTGCSGGDRLLKTVPDTEILLEDGYRDHSVLLSEACIKAVKIETTASDPSRLTQWSEITIKGVSSNSSDTVTVTGTVQSPTGAPVADVQIAVTGVTQKSGIVTNANGQFTVSGVAAGTILTPSKSGYVFSPSSVTVDASGAASFTAIQLGDANGDGNLDVFDFIAIFKKVSGYQIAVSPGADCNHNGQLNTGDIGCTLRAILSSPTDGVRMVGSSPGDVIMVTMLSNYSDSDPNKITVELQVYPCSGWSKFTGWSGGGCSGTNHCKVLLSSIHNVTATFERLSSRVMCEKTASDPTITLAKPPTSQKHYTLKISKGGKGSGTVTSSPDGISCGTTCSFSYDKGTFITLTAVPDDSESVFMGWKGACSGKELTCHLTLSKTKSVKATFEKKRYPLTLTAVGSGKVSYPKGGIKKSKCGLACEGDINTGFWYLPGTELTLKARLGRGARLDNWGEACSGTDKTCVITMSSSARNVTVTFIKQYLLKVSKSGKSNLGVVSSSPNGINCDATCNKTVSSLYDTGTIVTLTASPVTGGVFMAWKGGCVGTDSTCTVTMTKAQSVTAAFAASPN